MVDERRNLGKVAGRRGGPAESNLPGRDNKERVIPLSHTTVVFAIIVP